MAEELRSDPPALSFILCAGATAAAWWLIQNQHPGAEWFGIAGVIAAIFGLMWFSRGVDGLFVARRVRRVNRDVRRPGTAHGRSRWGRARDAKRAGMGRPGYFEIGTVGGRRVFKNGEGAALIISPPGGGKTSRLVIPQLLQEQRDEHGRPMSMVVLDPSGEIQAVTARRQRELRRETISIAPHAGALTDELGFEISDRGFNPLSVVAEAGEETKDIAWQLAKSHLPDDPRASGSSKFFNTAAQRLILFLFMYLAYRGHPTLADARRLCMSDPEGWDLTLADAQTSGAFGGTLGDLASMLIATRASEGEWSGTVNTAVQALEIFDDFGPVGRSVSAESGLSSFAELKTGPAKTVYITLPPEFAASHGAWQNLVLTAALEQMSRVRSNRKVLLLCDEIASSGQPAPAITRFIALGRKVGLVPALYLQSISQWTQIYGEPATRELVAMSELIVALGVRDRPSCQMLADLTGRTTVTQVSHNVQPDVFGQAAQGYSSTVGAQGRPLLFPEEVRELPEDEGVVIYKNAPPFLVTTTPYFRNPRLKRHADPNPYHRRRAPRGDRR